MTPEHALSLLRPMAEAQERDYNPAAQHEEADKIVMALLRYLGHGEIADAFEAAAPGWWYS